MKTEGVRPKLINISEGFSSVFGLLSSDQFLNVLLNFVRDLNLCIFSVL